jgi:lipoprotein-anchoring transpeptidase ErfK/SrfK
LKLIALREATALAVIASITASALSHAPTSSASGASAPVQLSNEKTITRWAYAVTRSSASAAPTPTAHRVGRLRFRTEDGFPEVYIALASVVDERGTAWVHVRLPQSPNNVTGWVQRSALGDLHVVHTKLVVNRRTLRVTLYDHGHQVFAARVGVGKLSTPTPAGSFWIREKFRVAGNPLYGARAMGTAAYSRTLTDWPGGGIVGLHGTSEPGLIPGRPSHGCVRLRNRDIKRLYALTPVGTPLLIK